MRTWLLQAHGAGSLLATHWVAWDESLRGGGGIHFPQGLLGHLLSLRWARQPVTCHHGVFTRRLRGCLWTLLMGLACPFAGCWEAGWGPVPQVSPTPHWAFLFHPDRCLATYRMGILGGSVLRATPSRARSLSRWLSLLVFLLASVFSGMVTGLLAICQGAICPAGAQAGGGNAWAGGPCADSVLRFHLQTARR